MISPAVLLLLAWMIVPLGMTIYFSFLSYNLLTPGSESFVGFLNYSYFLTDAAFFEARANPSIGIATSSLTDAFGLAYLIDADAQLHWANLFGRLGLSLGYTFRYQVWNVNASDLFPDATDDLFDYKGLLHLFRVGLNF